MYQVPWLFNVYMDGVMELSVGIGRMILGGWERVKIAWPLVCK